MQVDARQCDGAGGARGMGTGGRDGDEGEGGKSFQIGAGTGRAQRVGSDSGEQALANGKRPVRPVEQGERDEAGAPGAGEDGERLVEEIADGGRGVGGTDKPTLPVGRGQLIAKSVDTEAEGGGTGGGQLDGERQAAEQLDDEARTHRVGVGLPGAATLMIAGGEEADGGGGVEHVEWEQPQMGRGGPVARGDENGDGERSERLQRPLQGKAALDVVEQQQRGQERVCAILLISLAASREGWRGAKLAQGALAQLDGHLWRRYAGGFVAGGIAGSKRGAPGGEHAVIDPGETVQVGAGITADPGDTAGEGIRLARQGMQRLGGEAGCANAGGAGDNGGEANALAAPQRIEQSGALALAAGEARRAWRRIARGARGAWRVQGGRTPLLS